MTLVAQYHGTCSDCEEPIIPGQPITSSDDEGWQHVQCGQLPDKVECVCERCFLVHAGECF